MARPAYSENVRARVITDLASGLSISAAASRHGLSKGTVWNWWQQWCRDNDLEELVKDEVGDRLRARLLRYVEGGIDALVAHVELMGDKNWLDKQSASDLADLHASLSDRMVRVIERFGEPAGTPLPLALQEQPEIPVELAPPAGNPETAGNGDER
jgi:transposase-like protein